MHSYHQMTLAERVACGKAWLDEHAPQGYVFNMFIFEPGSICARFRADVFVNEYDILALAFKHDLKIPKIAGYSTISAIDVKSYFKMTQEQAVALGFDLPMKTASSPEYKELEKIWQSVFESELPNTCRTAGKLLAQIPKKRSGRKVFGWGAH